MPQLWPHQLAAVRFAESRSGALWYMGMGTGKTFAAIELMRRVAARKVLVIAPLKVCSVWPGEVAKYSAWPDEFEVVQLDRGLVRRRAEILQQTAQRALSPVIAVVNYESAWRKPMDGVLKDWRPDLVIFDESHKIKSPWGRASKFASAIAARSSRRLLLTGTPMPHSPLDIWSQFRALDASILGTSFVRFRARYAIIRKIGDAPVVVGFKNQDELASVMDRVTFRTSRDVLDLPEAVGLVPPNLIQNPLCHKAQRLYDRLESGIAAEIEQGSIDASNALTKLTRLRQLTGGLARTDGGDVQIDESKREALEELLGNMPPDAPCVVFGVYHHDLDQIAHAALRANRKHFELSGRRNQLEEFQRDDSASVIGVQIQAGGVGVDLTRAPYCVFYAPTYSLGDYEQAVARVHRPGQRATTHYYHLVATGTVDEVVYSALAQKRSVVEAVLNKLKGISQHV